MYTLHSSQVPLHGICFRGFKLCQIDLHCWSISKSLMIPINQHLSLCNVVLAALCFVVLQNAAIQVKMYKFYHVYNLNEVGYKMDTT